MRGYSLRISTSSAGRAYGSGSINTDWMAAKTTAVAPTLRAMES